MTKDKALTGAAGAYYVAFRLTAMEYAVGLTAYGTRSIDLLVANPNTGKSVTIQTKTMREAFRQSKKYRPFWNWRVGKSRPPAHKTFFYAFVDFKNTPTTQIPDVFIVPSIELRPLLVPFPEGVDLESPEVKDVWCDIGEEDAPKYRDRWDIIDDALA